MLTGNIMAALPAELIGLGVAGFIDESTALEHAVRAIGRVLVAGGWHFFGDASPEPVRYAKGGPEWEAEPAVLPVRERETVRLVASGLDSKETGAQVGLSPRAVEKERAQVMEKLGERDLPGLIRWRVGYGSM